MSRGGFENKEMGYGQKGPVGPQGESGSKRKGGKIPGVNNPEGLEPKSHGSKKRNLNPEGPRQGEVGK